MEPFSPIKSAWAQYFLKKHRSLLVRRQVWRQAHEELKDTSLQNSLIPYQLLCVFMSAMTYYLFRKESWKLKFVLTSGVFSVSYLNIQLKFEEELYLRKGLEDTKLGALIRKKYIEELPNYHVSEAFVSKQRKIDEFSSAFKHRKDPLKKFDNYIQKTKS